MMGFSERIRVPLGMGLVATRPLPLPGTSWMVHMGVVLWVSMMARFVCFSVVAKVCMGEG